MVLGSWVQRLHLGGECVSLQVTTWSAEHWQREAGTGPRWEAEGRRICSLVYVVSFGICVLGRPLSWGWRLRSGRLARAWALELPSYLAFFLSQRTNSNAEILLALPSVFKGSEVQQWQISLWTKGEFFLSLWWMILLPVNLGSNPAFPLLAEMKARQIDIYYHSFFLQIGASNSAHAVLFLGSIYLISATFLISGSFFL